MVRSLRLIHSPTPNWEEVRAFYRDTLGVPETGGWDQPGDRGSFLGLPAAEIEIMEADAAGGGYGIIPPEASRWHLALEVEDAEAELARLVSLGLVIERGLEVRPWGSRDFCVRDPAGNVVLIFDLQEGSAA